MIETRTLCGSCASGDHLCGGDCECGCAEMSGEEIEEMHWLHLQAEYGGIYGEEED